MGVRERERERVGGVGNSLNTLSFYLVNHNFLLNNNNILILAVAPVLILIPLNLSLCLAAVVKLKNRLHSHQHQPLHPLPLPVLIPFSLETQNLFFQTTRSPSLNKSFSNRILNDLKSLWDLWRE